MKRFKEIDICLQALLMIAGLVFCFVKGFDHFWIVYIAVGAWQLISMFIHDLLKWFTPKHSTRRYYHNVSYILSAIMLLSIWVPLFIWVFLLMFFAAPFMAAYYLSLCYHETYYLLKRPLSHLK